jgi:hypothetical protein
MPACPDDRQAGYVLNWEDERDNTLPSEPPKCWSREYDPDVLHGGEPQIRVATSPREPARCGNHSVRFELHQGIKVSTVGRVPRSALVSSRSAQNDGTDSVFTCQTHGVLTNLQKS